MTKRKNQEYPTINKEEVKLCTKNAPIWKNDKEKKEYIKEEVLEYERNWIYPMDKYRHFLLSKMI